MSAIK